MTLFDGNNKAPLTFGTAHFLISYLLCALASSMVNVFSGFVFKAAFFCNEFYKRLPWPNDLAINALAIQLQLLKFNALLQMMNPRQDVMPITSPRIFNKANPFLVGRLRMAILRKLESI